MHNFDKVVCRDKVIGVKETYTPQIIKDHGHLSMWGAEFEFSTADFVSEAIVNWAKDGIYPYTIVTDEFKEQVVWWMENQRNWTIQKEWIVPTYGITISLATAMKAFTNKGDGIITFSPVYHMYWEAVQFNERHKVSSKLIYKNHQYEIDFADLEEKMKDPKNKMLVLCNPHNPIAKVFTKEELMKIAALASRHDVIIFSDEIFAECLYDGIEMYTIQQVSSFPLKVIVATSLGKWLSFTGCNQANMIISDTNLREAFIKQRDKDFYGSMNPIMIPAYRAAYTSDGQQFIKELMAYIQHNYQFVENYFKQNIPEFKTIKPQGSYIVWVDASDLKMTEEELKDFMINKALFHVDFSKQYEGEDGFFRMNLAMPKQELLKNLESLKDAVNTLKKA